MLNLHHNTTGVMNKVLNKKIPTSKIVGKIDKNSDEKGIISPI